MKRIVCLGGGTGQSHLLRGLAPYGAELSALAGVTDDGGHTGALRRSLGIPAVGDLRSCLAALFPDGSLAGDLLRHRFERGSLRGASLGNLILAALIEREGSLSAAARRVSREAGGRSAALPVSDGSAAVCAELEDGRVVEGEWAVIRRRPRAAVRRVFHRPRLAAVPEALERLRRADLVVFSPGCLLTAVVSTAVAGGVREALRRSKGRKAFVVNLMTQPGQTDGLGARAHLEAFERLTGIRPDAALVNVRRPPAALVRRYAEKGARMVADDLGSPPGLEVVRADFLEVPDARALARYRRAGGRWKARPHFIRHDPRRLAKALLGLL